MIYFYRAVESNPTVEVFMAKGGRGDIASSPESKYLDSSTKKAMNKIASNLESKYFFEKNYVILSYIVIDIGRFMMMGIHNKLTN